MEHIKFIIFLLAEMKLVTILRAFQNQFDCISEVSSDGAFQYFKDVFLYEFSEFRYQQVFGHNISIPFGFDINRGYNSQTKSID